jgi:hypothetical protein
MCPGCVTTLALIAAGVSSTGGITALLMSKLRGKDPGTRDEDSDTDGRDTWRSEREAWSGEREAWQAESDRRLPAREAPDNEQGMTQ